VSGLRPSGQSKQLKEAGGMKFASVHRMHP
jgi:hypothetical protein